MIEYPNSKVPMELIDNTPIEYPLCKNDKEALIYLNLLLDKEFIYFNWLNYDLIDYEKLFYIEQNFCYNIDVKEKIETIKKMISDNYIIKNKYMARLQNKIINLDNQKRKTNFGQIHLPEYWLEGLHHEEEEE